jgi:hypothetical protein
VLYTLDPSIQVYVYCHPPLLMHSFCMEHQVIRYASSAAKANTHLQVDQVIVPDGQLPLECRPERHRLLVVRHRLRQLPALAV